MNDLFERAPEIITAASSSNLGIVALMVIVFSAISFAFFRRSHEVWRLVSLVLLFAGCMAFGFAVFKSSASEEVSARLSEHAQKLFVEAEAAKAAKTIVPGAALPSSLAKARNDFEGTWREASLPERRKLDPKQAYMALSAVNGLHRIEENDSSRQTDSTYWADESINYFRELQNPRLLTEALLDKAAIYLDIGQLGNDDRAQFERAAKEGDALMVAAYQTADKDQKPTVLRITSRFYYNLARPQSFRLSDNWDNNYLALAYDKALAASDLEPANIKNANQLARSTIKLSKNPPQDSDPAWTSKLRNSQQRLKAAWTANREDIVEAHPRLSALNVLGVVTMETIAREWHELGPQARRTSQARYLGELEVDSLAPLREAVALLQTSELRKSYGFDLYYDIARGHAVKIGLLRISTTSAAAADFENLKRNLLAARENAKTSQLESAIKDIGQELTFGLLTVSQRSQLVQLLSVGT
ncbi:MAG: hypothetical protein AB7O49_09745 [Sphingomonadales bacterium]